MTLTGQSHRRPRRSCSGPTAGAPGSPTSSPSRTSAAAPTAWPRYVVDRGETAKGVVIAYDRRFSSEHFAMAAAEVLLAHDIPVAFAVHAVPTQMSSYEVSSAAPRPASSSPPATTRGSTTASRSRHRPGPRPAPTSSASSRRRLAANGGIGIDRRPFADAEAAGLVERFDPYRRATSGSSARTVDLDALKARRHVDPGRPDVGRRQRLALAPAGRRPDPGRRDPPGAQPVLRRRQPGADPPEHRRGARRSWPAAATTSGCCSTAMPTGPAPPTSAARSSTSSRSRAC